MTARLDEPDVVVLDLRDGVGGVAEVEGWVVVLDHAEMAADNEYVYQALLGSPQVSGVICLALDGGNPDGAVNVRPPPSLAPSDRAATLWIGHHHGIRWRPTETHVRSNKPSRPSGLCQLIDVLGRPAVFDAVVKCVSTLRYSTASVGMALERATLPGAELRRVEGEAVIQVTDPDAGREVPRDEFRAAVRAVVEIDRTEDVLVAGAELAAARARAVTALERVDHEITRLDDRLAPFPRNRPGTLVGMAVEEARAAARDFHEKATRQLLRIDGNLRGEKVTGEVVAQLGVRTPVPARARQVRDDVRGLVVEWLGWYRSVGRLLADVDVERIPQEPQGCRAALAELERLAPPTGPAPGFATWPTRSLTISLAALSGVLVALGVAPAVLVPGLTLAWFAAGLLLHARQPTAMGETGFIAALPLATLRWALPVFAGASLVAISDIPLAPPPWGVTLTLLALLTLLGTVWVSWRRAVWRWRRALGLNHLRARVARTDQLLDMSVRREWRASARRALFAEGLRQVSIGLSTIRDVLAGKADNVFATPAQRRDNSATDGWGEDLEADLEAQPDQDIAEEVREVVVTDLVNLTIAALRPCWAGIEAGRPADPAEYARETERLLTVYREHVERHGLLAPPPFTHKCTRRATLATKLWASSKVAHALSRDVEDEMTQLCHAGQLGAVSAMAGGAQLVRFAPAAVRELGQDTTGPGVTWTEDAEVAGTLRFVPLRQGVFQ